MEEHMDHADLEISQEVRLVALRQLVAYAIAAAHPGLPEADATLDEAGRKMIRNCVEAASALADGRTASRNTVVSEFAEEVSQVMNLANAYRKEMRAR
jgi:hypothetical protein